MKQKNIKTKAINKHIINMKMINSIFVTVLFAASIVAIPRLHIPAAGGRIVDGDNANIQDYPYQVSIEYNGKYICSGSIIHELHVLTAAHCTDLRLIKDFKVRTSTSEQKKRWSPNRR